MAITSSNPGVPKVIKINVTSGVKGQPITISNRTTGDVMHETLGTTAVHTVDLQNFQPNNYTTGDVIDFSVAGAQIGSNSLTTSGNKTETITVSTATIGTTHTRGI